MEVNADSLAEVIASHRKYQSDYVTDRHIVAQAGLTEWGQWRQAVRETYTRYVNLRRAMHDLRRAEIAAEKHRATLADPQRSVEGEERTEEEVRLDLEDALLRIDGEKLRVIETARVFARFLAHAVRGQEKFGGLTEEEQVEHELEYWKTHTLQTAKLERLSSGRVSRNTWATVLSMPSPRREEVMAILQSSDASAHQVFMYEPALDSEPQLSTMEAVQELLDAYHSRPDALTPRDEHAPPRDALAPREA